MTEDNFDLLKNSLEGTEVDKELYARIFYIRIDKIINGIEEYLPKVKKKKNTIIDADVESYCYISAKIAYYYLMSVFKRGFADGVNLSCALIEAKID